jgi:hypothetical protein
MLGLGAISGALGQTTKQHGIILFTAEEAEKYGLSTGETKQVPAAHRSFCEGSAGKGPTIDIRKPDVTPEPPPPRIVTISPMDFEIRFTSASAKVNLDSLTIVARKNRFLSKDLMPLLGPYLDRNNATLQATAVKVPQGTFRIDIAIKDDARCTTEGSYLLEVK